jgi:ubiquinone/menaquinone biosynthesis C-methylase UbiE
MKQGGNLYGRPSFFAQKLQVARSILGRWEFVTKKKLQVARSILGRWEFVTKKKLQVARSILGRWEYRFVNFLRKMSHFILGVHPKTRICHPQWVMDHHLRTFARRHLSQIPSGSRVLDVGCGDAPYWKFNKSLDWSGIDIQPTGATNFIVNNDGSYPIANETFDYVLCTQVLEHVYDTSQTVREIERILKSGGIAIVNVPFIYPFHGMPSDFHRISTSGLIRLFSRFEITECGTIGGLGSSVVTLLNNHWSYQAARNRVYRLIHVLVSPILLGIFASLNVLALVVDKLDITSSFPLNTFILVKKKSSET